MTRSRWFAIATLVLAFAVSVCAQNSTGVFTSRYDVGRTGQNRSETILEPSNVSSTTFGKIFSYTVDGQVYAQPLWVQGVNIPGQGTHNVVYVVTQMDSVFAFDAGGTPATPLWQDSFIDPPTITPVPCGTDGSGSDISCGVYPYYGITGTPVIDPTTNTMYLVARTYNNNTYAGYQTLHALDITTGAEKFGGPFEIQGSVTGTGTGSQGGMITFNPLADIQRAGLLLLSQPGGETVYIGWAGAEHGWIMAYTNNGVTLTQSAIFATTPNATIGGVWQSGNGLAADSSGNVYAAVGDALFDANTGGSDYGDTLMKMNLTDSGCENGNDTCLQVVDYFTPRDQACRQANDMDLASSGPLVLPTQEGSYPLEIIQSGKGGNPCDPDNALAGGVGRASIYLVNQTNMGEYSPNQDNIIQEISGAPAGYWSSPAYWQTSNSTGSIYYAGVVAEGGTGDYLKMYSLNSGQLSTQPIAQSANTFPVGATPTVSSNGNSNGIVWAIERPDSLGLSPGQSPAVLYAFNATNLATLYASNQNVTRDQGGCANKFQVPTVIDGQVFVATQNEVDLFGLLGQPPAVSVALKQPCYTYDKQNVNTSSPPETEIVTNTGTSLLSISNIQIVGLDMSSFSETNTCENASLKPGQTCSIKMVFTPQGAGPCVAQLLITDNAPNSPQNAQLMGKGVGKGVDCMSSSGK